MPQFFVKSSQINADKIFIENSDDINHIRNVLRSKIGDDLNFIDDKEYVYSAEVVKVEKKRIVAQVITKEKSKRKLSIDITLAQSVLKNNAQDFAIQKATELGTPCIIPIITSRSVPKFSGEKDIKSKVEKWGKIAFETCKQCERSTPPVINSVISLKELFALDFDLKIVCLERRSELSLKKLLRSNPIKENEKILLVIGPEGGFSDEEIKLFEDNNFYGVTLGNLILRAETAVISALSSVIYEYEN